MIAIEQRAELLGGDKANNLAVICGDARTVEFPIGMTRAVLLMRHCRHFALYREKLERIGCRALITNARRGMDVEVIDLALPRITFEAHPGGWYGCACGKFGYKPAETADIETVVEVCSCPNCE